MARRLIGYGYTDSSGVAHITNDPDGETISGYTGVGAGEIQIVAELHDDSSVVSQPITVYDCTKYDKGLSGDGNHNDIWSGDTTNLSRETEYSSLKETSGNIAIYTGISNECTIEMEVLQVDGAITNTIIQFPNGSNVSKGTATLQHCGGTLNTWTPIKIDLTTTKATITNLDTSNSVEREISDDTVARFKLITSNEVTELRFRNVKIYP